MGDEVISLTWGGSVAADQEPEGGTFRIEQFSSVSDADTAVPTVPQLEGEAEDQEPNVALWLWYLFFAPKRFFRHFVIDSMPFLTVLCAWAYGMTNVIDQIETRYITGRLDTMAVHLSKDWGFYFGIVLGMGAFSGLMYYAIGGWWYRKRLDWSGADTSDRRLVRRVYLYASQVIAIPVVFMMLAQSTMHKNPIDMFESPSVWPMLILVFPFWSIWTSYRGVTTVYEGAARKKLRLWFLILPMLVMGIFVGGTFAAGVVIEVGNLNEPPDLSKTNVYQSGTMGFEYPGNWSIDTDEGIDPDMYVGIEAMQDAFVNLIIYESPAMAEEELAQTVASFQQGATRWRDQFPMSRWGSLSGTGVTAVADLDGKPYRYTLFVSEVIPGWYIETREICLAEQENTVDPGFDLIRSTFKIRSRSRR